MVIDLEKLTFEQANKIECALLQMQDDFKARACTWSQLATDSTFSEQSRENFMSNAKWWAEVYKLIYGEEM